MRLCEVYTSIQGEGPNTGKPITFVRFGGCNLRCPGWGQGELPDGTIVEGCDTVFAVYPEWHSYWSSHTPEEVKLGIPALPKHVCLTGGEPLIQPSKQLQHLVELLWKDDFKIDLFTNGTQDLGKHPWTQDYGVTVIMDWKLPGSGEGGSFNSYNLVHLKQKDAIKFVVKDREDFDEALRLINWANEYTSVNAQVWFSPVWGVMDTAALASWVQEEAPNCRLNIQTHKYIWQPDARRV